MILPIAFRINVECVRRIALRGRAADRRAVYRDRLCYVAVTERSATEAAEKVSRASGSPPCNGCRWSHPRHIGESGGYFQTDQRDDGGLACADRQKRAALNVRPSIVCLNRYRLWAN